MLVLVWGWGGFLIGFVVFGCGVLRFGGFWGGMVVFGVLGMLWSGLGLWVVLFRGWGDFAVYFGFVWG